MKKARKIISLLLCFLLTLALTPSFVMAQTQVSDVDFAKPYILDADMDSYKTDVKYTAGWITTGAYYIDSQSEGFDVVGLGINDANMVYGQGVDNFEGRSGRALKIVKEIGNFTSDQAIRFTKNFAESVNKGTIYMGYSVYTTKAEVIANIQMNYPNGNVGWVQLYNNDGTKESDFLTQKEKWNDIFVSYDIESGKYTTSVTCEGETKTLERTIQNPATPSSVMFNINSHRIAYNDEQITTVIDDMFIAYKSSVDAVSFKSPSGNVINTSGNTFSTAVKEINFVTNISDADKVTLEDECDAVSTDKYVASISGNQINVKLNESLEAGKYLIKLENADATTQAVGEFSLSDDCMIVSPVNDSVLNEDSTTVEVIAPESLKLALYLDRTFVEEKTSSNGAYTFSLDNATGIREIKAVAYYTDSLKTDVSMVKFVGSDKTDTPARIDSNGNNVENVTIDFNSLPAVTDESYDKYLAEPTGELSKALYNMGLKPDGNNLLKVSRVTGKSGASDDYALRIEKGSNCSGWTHGKLILSTGKFKTEGITTVSFDYKVDRHNGWDNSDGARFYVGNIYNAVTASIIYNATHKVGDVDITPGSWISFKFVIDYTNIATTGGTYEIYIGDTLATTGTIAQNYSPAGGLTFMHQLNQFGAEEGFELDNIKIEKSFDLANIKDIAYTKDGIVTDLNYMAIPDDAESINVTMDKAISSSGDVELWANGVKVDGVSATVSESTINVAIPSGSLTKDTDAKLVIKKTTDVKNDITLNFAVMGEKGNYIKIDDADFENGFKTQINLYSKANDAVTVIAAVYDADKNLEQIGFNKDISVTEGINVIDLCFNVNQNGKTIKLMVLDSMSNIKPLSVAKPFNVPAE